MIFLEKDLTVGNPSSVLWKFSIPMFLSVIFQQMYNIADTAIAGKFAGEQALAAVGASAPITMIFMAFAIGSNIGCSVVVSRLFGEKKITKMKTAITTAIISFAIEAIILMIIGFVFCSPMLELLNTPKSFFDDAALYLKIYTAGLIFVFLYNACNGVFTSLGDSKTPLYLLTGSSVGNVVLDYIFVRYLHKGVAGVAWATFIAQGVACIAALVILIKRVKKIQTDTKPPLWSKKLLKEISAIAVPSILQQSFVSVGNLFIQGLINVYDEAVIAGFTAAIKLNSFSLTAFSTLANGISAFTAQNMGARKYQRVKQGFFAGQRMSAIVAVPFVILLCFFGKYFVGFFLNSDSSALTLDTGVIFLRIVSPFYFVASIKIISDSVLRGIGNMKAFMISTFVDLILRVILAYILSGFFSSTGIWMSWPAGWVVGTAISIWFYAKESKKTLKVS